MPFKKSRKSTLPASHGKSKRLCCPKEKPTSTAENTVSLAEKGQEENTEKQPDDYCWQMNECNNWQAQLIHIFTASKFTDCTFIVTGADGISEEFKCHKVMMAKSSPVFEKMLFGPLSKNNSAGCYKITNVEHISFKMLLGYIYSGKVGYYFTDFTYKDVCQLWTVADMYLMTDLKKGCFNFIMHKLEASDVCFAYELAKEIEGLQPLGDKAATLLQSHTHEIISNKTFLEAAESTILYMVEKKTLNIRCEAELIHFINKWAKHQLEINKQEINTENIQKTIGPIFQHLRFLTLSKEKFLNEVDGEVMLSTKEKYDLLKYINYGFINLSSKMSRVKYSCLSKERLKYPKPRLNSSSDSSSSDSSDSS